MRTRLAAPMLAGTLLCAASVRAAAPETLSGGPADLVKAVDARAAGLGKIVHADGPLAQVAPRKGALMRVVFNDVLPVRRGARGSAFMGHHVVPAGSDFALVVFPDDVEVSTHSASVVVGSFAGTRTISGAKGAKVRATVISARVVGVLDGVEFAAGVPTFAPNSPIRVYRH